MSTAHAYCRTGRIAALFFALLASAELARAEVDVRFTTDVDWTLTPVAEGLASRTHDGIYLHLNRVVVSASPELSSSSKLHGVRFGLVLGRPDGSWRVSRWSKPVTLEIDLEPGEDIELKRLSGTIPIELDQSLKDQWLVMECSYTFRGVKATSYAHSSRTVLMTLSE